MCMKAASRELMAITDLSFLTMRWGAFSARGLQCPKSWRKGKIRTKVTVLQLLHLKLQLFSKMEAPAFVWMAKFIYVTSLC